MIANSMGRPARDASGRLWFACQGDVHFVDDKKAGERPAVGLCHWDSNRLISTWNPMGSSGCILAGI